jgi:hypothetical protein
VRLLKIIIGVILIAAAFWPVRLAFVMFGVVRSRIASPPRPHVTHYVILHGHQLAPWQIYAIPAASEVIALILIAGGLYFICAEPHDDN